MPLAENNVFQSPTAFAFPVAAWTAAKIPLEGPQGFSMGLPGELFYGIDFCDCVGDLE
jgi:hypothetical protein